jgi:hypothetical protein
MAVLLLSSTAVACWVPSRRAAWGEIDLLAEDLGDRMHWALNHRTEFMFYGLPISAVLATRLSHARSICRMSSSWKKVTAIRHLDSEGQPARKSATG